MIEYPVESFPCLKCGRVLTRVTSDYEGQPNDGIMCSSHGNYGSTVFDPMDGSYLAFNICDPCVKRAARQGRLMVTRDRIHVKTHKLGIIGSMKVERPYIAWTPDLADDGDAKGLEFDIEELERYAGKIQFNIPLEQIKMWENEEP
jgi:hypothetical protein